MGRRGGNTTILKLDLSRSLKAKTSSGIFTLTDTEDWGILYGDHSDVYVGQQVMEIYLFAS